MDVLNETKNEDVAIFRAHVKRTLKEHAAELDKVQRERISGFSSDFWSNRNITTNEQSLFYRHIGAHRLVDMKTRVVGERKIKKGYHEVHNRMIMGHYNGIQLDITYGLTEQVKENLRKEFHGKVI